MIDEIWVENLALIKTAHLEPARGLTVLTGETGAGKTALLSALSLLMGERADKSAVRDGARELQVSGRFFGAASEEAACDDGTDASDGEVARGDGEVARGDVAGEIVRAASKAGAEGASTSRDGAVGAAGDGAKGAAGEEDFELVVCRRVSADGRSRATINGHMASVGELAERTSVLVDLCGQHEHQQLMKSSLHRGFLDRWAHDDIAPVLAAYEAAFDAHAQAAAELARVQSAAAQTSAKLDEARFVLSRIDAIDPHEGEYEDLSAYLAKAENAEALARAVNTAHEALSGESGALDTLDTAAGALESAARYDEKLGEAAASLREAAYVLEDVSREALSYRDDIDFDGAELARAQERFSDLQGLMRAYGPRMVDVFARRAEAADTVSLVDNAHERIEAAQRAVVEAEEVLVAAAEALASARSTAAPLFAEAVTAQMARLEMGSARMVCAVESLSREAWTRGGTQAIEFMFCPGAGMSARPLVRIASGGEISRVMLAIKVVLGDRDSVDTLVFDEVDAGVGGSTAVALAEVLADLARTHQVIVVTHLAQVAVRGERHYVVRKTEGDVEGADVGARAGAGDDVGVQAGAGADVGVQAGAGDDATGDDATGDAGMPQTQLVCLSDEERPAEIARMLSGSVTETSLEHARELLGAH